MTLLLEREGESGPGEKPGPWPPQSCRGGLSGFTGSIQEGKLCRGQHAALKAPNQESGHSAPSA